MLPLFIDTSYILALVNAGDQHHARATATALQLQATYLTTEAVLTEVGNALARPLWRSLGVTTLTELRADPDIEVISVDEGLFDRAFELYAARPDKSWGLTDCISFVVMQEHGLTQVLTTDKHFEQAGFLSALIDL